MISPATPSYTDHDPTVLVVEEDPAALVFVADNLEADRYRVRTADSREKALAILSVQQPDVIVVDVNGKTLGLIDAIRTGDGLAGRVDPDTPLIVLTTRVDELHRIRVLDRGGDDVLAKPYSYPELRARIIALLRRARARRAPRMLRVGQLTIDLAARIVEIDENRLELPAKEYELLRTLAREPTRVFTNVNFGTSRVARVSRDPRFRDEKSDPLPPSWTMSNSPPPGRRIMRPATGFSYFIPSRYRFLIRRARTSGESTESSSSRSGPVDGCRAVSASTSTKVAQISDHPSARAASIVPLPASTSRVSTRTTRAS
jgi:DNA-binding response OmpR family regulator